MPQRAIKQGVWKRRLVGTAEIAEMLGVHKSTVTQMAKDGRLPEPYDTLQLGRVWRYEDVEALADQLLTAHGRANSAAMRAHWASRRRLEARRAPSAPQKGNPSTGTSSSKATR